MNHATPISAIVRALGLVLVVAPGAAFAENLEVGALSFAVPTGWAVGADQEPVRMAPPDAASPNTLVVLPAETTPAPGAELGAVLAEGWKHFLTNAGLTEVAREPEEPLTTVAGAPAALTRGRYRGVDGQEYQAAFYAVQNGDHFSFVYFFAGGPEDFDRFLPGVTAMVAGAQPAAGAEPTEDAAMSGAPQT